MHTFASNVIYLYGMPINRDHADFMLFILFYLLPLLSFILGTTSVDNRQHLTPAGSHISSSKVTLNEPPWRRDDAPAVAVRFTLTFILVQRPTEEK